MLPTSFLVSELVDFDCVNDGRYLRACQLAPSLGLTTRIIILICKAVVEMRQIWSWLLATEASVQLINYKLWLFS